MFSLFWANSCNALFHCSHMSHATFHSFSMISAVHLLLDFLKRACFHSWSCCSHHSILNHPSQMYCFPILSWVWLGSILSECVVPGSFHVHMYSISSWQRCVSVPSYLRHLSRSASDFSHSARAVGLGHLRMCALSLRVWVHLGHCAEVWNFPLCLFLPVAKWPKMYFAIQHLRFGGISLIALPIDSQSMVFHTPLVKFHHCLQ